jgi:hypothetical protein
MAANRINGSSSSMAACPSRRRSKPSSHRASAIPALPPNIVYKTLVEQPTSPAMRRMVRASGPCV